MQQQALPEFALAPCLAPLQQLVPAWASLQEQGPALQLPSGRKQEGFAPMEAGTPSWVSRWASPVLPAPSPQLPLALPVPALCPACRLRLRQLSGVPERALSPELAPLPELASQQHQPTPHHLRLPRLSSVHQPESPAAKQTSFVNMPRILVNTVMGSTRQKTASCWYLRILLSLMPPLILFNVRLFQA